MAGLGVKTKRKVTTFVSVWGLKRANGPFLIVLAIIVKILPFVGQTLDSRAVRPFLSVLTIMDQIFPEPFARFNTQTEKSVATLVSAWGLKRANGSLLIVFALMVTILPFVGQAWDSRVACPF